MKLCLNGMTYYFFWLLHVFLRASLRYAIGRARRDILFERIRYKGLRTLTQYIEPINFPVLNNLPWGRYLTSMDRKKAMVNAKQPFLHEPEVYQWINLRRGDIAIDIGAHHGWFTLYFSHLVGKTGRVVAVEPCPLNLQFLQENIRLNLLSNVEVIPFALSDKPGRAELVLGDHSGVHTIMFPTGTERKRFQVSTTTLDDMLVRFGKVNLVKMDIEGAELCALNACKQLGKVARFIVEVHKEELLIPPISLFRKNQFGVETIAKNRLVATRSE